MLSFACIVPHPPIIIPGIGWPEDLAQVTETIKSMRELSEELKKINPETLLLISPHAPLEADAFLVNVEKKLRGDFINFGLREELIFENNPELVKKIADSAGAKGFNIGFHESQLDHGALVPLYYLTREIKPRLIHCSFSFQDFETHYRYGEVIGRVLSREEEKIVVIASGDLSHRLKPEAPAGYSPKGKIFDEALIEKLKRKDIQGLLEIDQNLVESAGECGLRSILILLGVVGKEYYFQILSYESPFGVGYLTAQFKL